MDVLINLMGGNPFKMNMYIIFMRDVHFNYLTILYVNYTSIKLK